MGEHSTAQAQSLVLTVLRPGGSSVQVPYAPASGASGSPAATPPSAWVSPFVLHFRFRFHPLPPPGPRAKLCCLPPSKVLLALVTVTFQFVNHASFPSFPASNITNRDTKG